jgi:MFS family permease
VREPIRGLQDQAFSPKAEPASMISALKQLLSQPLFSCIQLGGACYSLWGYGMSLWVAPFFARTHQLPIEYLASWLAAGAFFGGISGAWLSGRLADRLGREKLSGYLLIPIVGTLLGVLATAVMLQASSWKLGMAMFLVQQLCSSFYAGPVYALMQMTVPVQLRAQAVAVHLFVVNVVGLGAGPLLIGWLSDLYTPSLGAAQALTNGLLLVSCGGLLMIVIFAIGMRMLREGALVLNSKATSI